MDDLFNLVLEKEKYADSKIANSKEEASKLLLECDDEIAKKIKAAKEACINSNNDKLEAVKKELFAKHEEKKVECQKLKESQLSSISDLIDICSNKVVEILTNEYRG